jgi:hypothetical protein
MTDFLTSLAARSFGTEAAIRPRVASLFEPVGKVDASLRGVAAAEPVGGEIEPEIQETESARNQKRPSAAPREVHQPRDPEYSEEEIPVAAKTPIQRTSMKRTMTPAGEDDERQGTAVAEEVRPRKVLLPREENAKELELDRISDSRMVTPKAASARVAADFPVRDEASESDSSRLTLPPKVAAVLASQMKNADLTMNARPGVTRLETSGTSSPVLATAPEPSVHVTIGRIEVRATSEAKAAGPRRVASAVMSLDEYLRQRTQRGER